MKKILLLTKSFVILSLLFCSIGVFADIPKTINVQGKVTNDSGGPITSTTAKVYLYISDDGFVHSTTCEPVGTQNSVKVDSEGLYNVDMNLSRINFDASKKYEFKVEVVVNENGVTNRITSEAKPFASSPFAFYASSSTYSLV